MASSISPRYWRPAGIAGIDLLRADESTHRYARHSHDAYAVGVVEAGAHTFSSRGEKWTAIAGRVVLVNPDDAHDGGPATPDGGYSYRMFYVDSAAFADAIEEAGDGAAVPFFRAAVVGDVPLAVRLLRLHRILEEPAAKLERDETLITALAELARRHGGTAPAEAKRSAGPRGVAAAHDYLTENFTRDLSLAELAAVAGVNRFQLLRSFRRCYDLPPHLYQTQLRLRHAKRLLLAGEAPAMAAAAAGFADQSHLIRKFKAAYGVTPGQYLGRGSQALQ